MGNTTITIKDEVVVKQYRPESLDRYVNEKYFYQYYSEFCPKLVSFNDDRLELVTEMCTPILDVKNSIIYRDKLWKLLEKLHRMGANHRDVALINVVIKDGEPLLIDWESATKNISEISVDLYGHVKAGLTPPWKDYGANGIWWNEPWDVCPGRYWSG